MDLVLALLGFACVVGGIFGSFLPVLPGPALGWTGILLLYLTRAVPMDYWMLGITLVIMIAITALDYVIPAKGAKRFGGSRAGVWGTNIGLVAGLIAPVPFGFVIGPFVGAFIGELIHDAKDYRRAFRAALGSLVGFFVSTLVQFAVCVIFLGIFLRIAWHYRGVLF